MQILLKISVTILVTIILNSSARSGDALPERLTVGYEDEGKVDGSLPACTAYVKDMTEWNKTETDRGVKKVCAARKRHIDAYQVLQMNYKIFLKSMAENERLDATAAVANFKTLIKACMDHKWNLTTGGHNIALDITQNEIATACLTLGANLLKQENAQLMSR